MRVIIAGSREGATTAIVKAAMDTSGFAPSLIVSGTARGVDRLGEQWARHNDVPIRQYPARWDEYGKSAGYKRNAVMAANADALVAIWDGQSLGTRHMVNLARARGIQVFVYNFKEVKERKESCVKSAPMPTSTKQSASPPVAAKPVPVSGKNQMTEEFDTVMVFDTETTGLPDYKKRSSDPSQPVPLQLAAALYASPKGQNNWRRESVLYCLMPIGDREIHPKAFEAHGITNDKANSLGLDVVSVLELFADMCDIADKHVAHNIVFDTKLMKIAYAKIMGEDYEFPLVKEKKICTMFPSVPIVKAPKKPNKHGVIHKGFKWPTLEETMQHFFGHGVGEMILQGTRELNDELEPVIPERIIHKYADAHDAMADVDACAKVYFELLKRNVV